MASDLVPGDSSDRLAAGRSAMPIPTVCIDARVRQGAACFGQRFSKPHYQHFVPVPRGCCARRRACSRACGGRLRTGQASLA